MSGRKSTNINLLVSRLDSRIKDKILNYNIDPEKLKKFDETEKKETISELYDLKDLKNKTESEIYKALNLMFKNKQYKIFLNTFYNK